MRKSEIEQAIKNGESVWLATEYGIKELKNLKLKDGLLVYYNEDYKFNHAVEENYFDDLYKSQAEAEHYLHHANVTRVEQLPFLTWEEFLEDKNFEFFDKNGILTWLYINTSKTSESIHLNNRFEKLNDWELTEENFYKAYDECVRLFKS